MMIIPAMPPSALSNIIRRLCRTLSLTDKVDEVEGEGEERKSMTIHDKEEDDDDDNDNNEHTDMLTPIIPPRNAHSSPSLLSSLPLPPPPPPPPSSPSTDISPNRTAPHRSISKLSKLSSLSSHSVHAPSTPRSSSSSPSPPPRLLKSFSRFGIPSSPSSPSFHGHAPKVSFSSMTTTTNSNTGKTRDNLQHHHQFESNENVTPPLSFCSKEVAEDPFARICPSPELLKQLSIKTIENLTSSDPRNTATTSRPSSYKVSSRHHLKSSIRPSTAPSLSLMKNESARSSALDFACAGRKSMVDADNGPLDDVSTQPATLNTYKPKKPVLPAISTSYCSSPGILSSDGHISSSSSCSSSSSSAWPLTGSPTSPSSPDASYFSSSFSSTRSGFTDSSFTTVETVTTCTLSSEGGGRTGSAERPQRRQKKGRDDYQLNTFDMDIFGIPSRMQNTHTPASFRREESKQKESTYQQPISVANTLHSMSMPPDGRARMLLGFENTNTSQSSEARHNTMTLSFPEEISAFGREEDDSFADEGFVPDAIVKRGLEAQERLKFLRPAHTASRFIEDLRRSQDGSEGITQNSNVTESSLTRFEKDTSSGLLDSDNTFYDRFRPQLRFSGHRYNLPVCKRSFTSPALLSSSSSSSFFSPSTLGRKEDQTSSNMNRKEGNQSHSCTPTPSGSSTPRGDTYTSISPFELLNRVIAQEDEREVLIAEAAGKENSTATNVGVLPNNMDHYHLVDNHGIVFTQSTFDLRLHYEDNGTRTSIPLPQMSWFPEPPLKITSSSSSPSSELLSTSSSSLSKKQPSLFSSRPNALNKKKNYIRPATSDGIRAEGNRNILMNWNIRSRGKPRIGKNSIGYPVAST